MDTTEATGSGPRRARGDTVVAIDKGKQKEQPEIEQLAYRPARQEASNSSLQLPTYQRLKGRENYPEWKKNFLNLAKSAGMSKYFIDDPLRPKPKKITIENVREATRDERLDWDDWEAGEAKAILMLS